VSAGGAERCQSILNNSNLFRVIPRRSDVAYANFTVSTTCEVSLYPDRVGTTWVVFETGGLRDSIFVRTVPRVASVQIVEDSVVIDQQNPSAAQPVLTWRALDPRGQDQCASFGVVVNMTTQTRNPSVANALDVLSGCRARVIAGSTGPEGIGTTFVTLQFLDFPILDSVRVRGVSNALQFTNEGITGGTSLTTLGSVAAGDTLRAGVSRQVAMRVVTRTGQPVAGALVTFTATPTLPAPVTTAAGTFAPATALTDSTGVARSTYTPPQRLFQQNTSGPEFTLPVSLDASARGPSGQSVVAPSGVSASAAVRVYPGAPARLLVHRVNPSVPDDTTQVVTADSLFVGQASNTLRLRAYDANGNQIGVAGIPTPLVTSTRPEGAGVTLQSSGSANPWTINLTMPRDSTTATFTLGAATRTLLVRARPTTLLVGRNGGVSANLVARSLYNDVPSAVTTVYTTPGGQSVFFPAFTGSRDTVAFTAVFDEGGGNVRGRTYLRPMSGAGAATAATPAGAVTLGISAGYSALANSQAAVPVGYPAAAFAPSTTDRGTVYFVSDSAAAFIGTVYARTAGGTLTTCVANTNPFIVPNGLAVNGDGTQLAVTTHGRVDVGTGTDSTTRSQVWVYALPGCTLIGTGPITSNTSGDVIYRSPQWVGNTLVVNRVTAVSGSSIEIRFGPMSTATGAITLWQTIVNALALDISVLVSQDPAPGGRLLQNVGTSNAFVDATTGVSATPLGTPTSLQQATYGRR
jgi:hypothetical protein